MDELKGKTFHTMLYDEYTENYSGGLCPYCGSHFSIHDDHSVSTSCDCFQEPVLVQVPASCGGGYPTLIERCEYEGDCPPVGGS